MFNGLRLGVYFVTESAPDLFQPGKSAAGTAGGVADSRSVRDIAIAAVVAAVGYNFAEEQRPGCALADIAFHVGRSYARVQSHYQTNSAPFVARAPRLAKFMSSGVIPKGVSTFPTAPVSYYWVPTLGTKVVPSEPWVGRIKVVKGKISPG